MTEEEKMELAKSSYKTLCDTFEEKKLVFNKDEENLSISTKLNGRSGTIDVLMRIYSEQSLVRVFIPLPVIVKEDKRLDVAVAVSYVNATLGEGNFDFDIVSGRLAYKLANSFIESELSGDLFSYMLFCAYTTVDNNISKLMAIANGLLTLNDFIKEASGGEE